MNKYGLTRSIISKLDQLEPNVGTIRPCNWLELVFLYRSKNTTLPAGLGEIGEKLWTVKIRRNAP